jgi:hypothetical protein
MFTTPGGMPASFKTEQSIHAVTDVISEGLQTHVFPTEMAGAIFQVRR